MFLLASLRPRSHSVIMISLETDVKEVAGRLSLAIFLTKFIIMNWTGSCLSQERELKIEREMIERRDLT